MKCFKCKKGNFSSRALIVHLKIYHSLTEYSDYQCYENSCFQYFGCLKNFRKHIKNHEKKLGHTNFKREANLELNLSNQPCGSTFHLNGRNSSISCANETVAGTNETDYPNQICAHDQLSHSNLSLPTVDLAEVNRNLDECYAKFCLQLHKNNNFNRKNVEQILQSVAQFITEPIANHLENTLKAHDVSSELSCILSSTINMLKNVYHLCKTEYKLNKWLQDKNLLVPLNQVSIYNEISIINRNGESVYDETSTKAVFFSLDFQMKLILEKINDFRSIITENYTSENNPFISSFIEGNLWKTKIKQLPGALCVPYFLYFDGFEINNPLGSHSESITGIYFSFPFYNNISRTENIFFSGFIKSQHLKSFGNDSCLKYLVNQIKTLEEEGVMVNLSGTEYRIHFILGLIVGDNLGVNDICDFNKSFSSNFFCRFCKCHKSETQRLCENKLNKQRNIQNYDIDVSEQLPKETGIQRTQYLIALGHFMS